MADVEMLGPLDGVDVEAGLVRSGPAPVGRSLTDAERADIQRQLTRRTPPQDAP